MTSITIPLPYTCLLQHISLGISRKFNESNVYDWLVVVIKMCIVSLLTQAKLPMAMFVCCVIRIKLPSTKVFE